MAIAKRVFLFLVVNFLVFLTISFLLRIFNIQPYLTHYGIDFTSLAIFCLIWGFAGSMISLFLSKSLAKRTPGMQIINPNTSDPQQKQVLDMVYKLSKKASLPSLPEVGIYRSPEPNAFATGATKNSSFVAVSTGLLQRMNEQEVEGVVGHEITHVANGDMVTMTLLQGIVNAFVMFFARAVAFVLARGDDQENNSFSGGMYYLTSSILEVVLMFLGSIVIAFFSRSREFRADRGGALLSGKENMINALRALKRSYNIRDPRTEDSTIQALKISGPGDTFLMKLFASHPPLDERIARLQALK